MKGWVDLGNGVSVPVTRFAAVGRTISGNAFYENAFYELVGDGKRYTPPFDFDELCRRIAEAEGGASATEKARPEDITILPTGWLTLTEADIQHLPLEDLLHLFANARACGRAKFKALQAEAFQIAVLEELERRTKPEPRKVKVRVLYKNKQKKVYEMWLIGTGFRVEVHGDLAYAIAKTIEHFAALGLEAEFDDET